MPYRRRFPRDHALAVTACLAAAGLFLIGCESDGGDKAAEPTGRSVIAPGKPGEPAQTLSPQEAAQKSDVSPPNSADFDYVRMMIEHHQQALVMTELAPKQAESTKVKRLAARIAAGQGPEIGTMRGWLKEHGERPMGGQGDKDGKDGKGGDGGGHDHGDVPMRGMATEAQLKALRAAKGDAFDALFLKLMITHHDGAVAMATDVLGQGNNIRIEQMANDVIAQQTTEIGRMRGMQ
ncbi:DUF305 domain-containing protein [Streptomyces apocyni]|uniref:DUF305 domain-containing protein n=1 Tax=Streptomyces apocyni TaxID=2654677 RepID=UPI0012EAD3CA|nr:DUF305 domain-containing protein [Streptomyces apocyni]